MKETIPTMKNLYNVVLNDANDDLVVHVISIGKANVRKTLTALARLRPSKGTLYVSHAALCFDGYLINSGHIATIPTNKVYGHDNEDIPEIANLND